ncbi:MULTISPECIES: ArnT family glycosyltransferase [Halomonas]|uniref:ArnT family glycosyltransferase n=1 Tax=Halomonas TaxID=2745 RepID=UPI001C96BAEA|nr:MULTISPECIES: glycosyltransferase family 39 protein [Halomonas]MBY6208573.1 glycosyltransferase family 39 protein [Halomonas sp. DP3Y7-2]MBY6227044.1 glycosyltransferase family 39 protein [Halomonas sp. DP3Y7-1]MCA0915208.1 glycosyltransferase family 39 protein [Halomonas denitrificans]
MSKLTLLKRSLSKHCLSKHSLSQHSLSKLPLPHLTPLTTVMLAAALLTIVRVASTPLMPIDETRYLGVAWEMWQRHLWLVPQLNGEPYAHKPPLLFWLIHLAWAIFGTDDPVGRLAVPLVGLLSYPLLVAIVRVGFPQSVAQARWAPGLLLGMTLWSVFLPLSMFDILLTTCLLLAVLGLVGLARYGGTGWVVMSGVGLGLGLLAKGPVILLYWLPLALGIGWWSPRSLGASAMALCGSGTIGLAMGLAWALPAAQAGGADYARDILWGQFAGRVSHSFAHARPWYWYLPLIPLALFPWSMTSLWWRPRLTSRLARLALLGVLPAVLVLSLISGKQAHYLIPTLPFAALWISLGLPGKGQPLLASHGRWLRHMPWLAVPLLLVMPELLQTLGGVTPVHNGYRALALVPLLLAMIAAPQRSSRLALLVWPVTLTCLLVSTRPLLTQRYDLTPLAQRLHQLETRGTPVAYAGRYADQFQYLGRLQRPLVELEDDEVDRWWASHPNGRIVTSDDQLPLPENATTILYQPYRGKTYRLLTRSPNGRPGSVAGVHPPLLWEGQPKAQLQSIPMGVSGA